MRRQCIGIILAACLLVSATPASAAGFQVKNGAGQIQPAAAARQQVLLAARKPAQPERPKIKLPVRLKPAPGVIGSTRDTLRVVKPAAKDPVKPKLPALRHAKPRK
ncbi:MAG: hypothetical protein ACM3QZ_01150 [Solirubrobacterales bacterium]